MKHKFLFKVLIDDESSPTGYYLERGLGFAENYSEAAENIENYYRDTLVKIIELILLSSSGEIAQVPEEVYKTYLSEDEFGYAEECDENCNIRPKVEKIANEDKNENNF